MFDKLRASAALLGNFLQTLTFFEHSVYLNDLDLREFSHILDVVPDLSKSKSVLNKLVDFLWVFVLFWMVGELLQVCNGVLNIKNTLF